MDSKDADTVIFDLFGTLVVRSDDADRTLDEAFGSLFPEQDVDTLKRDYSEIVHDFRGHCEKNEELSFGCIFGRLGSMYGVHLDLPEAEKKVLVSTKAYVAADDSLDILTYLRDSGYRIGVLSNTRYSSDTLRCLLDDVGLLCMIDSVVASSEVGYRKPHHAAYDMVISKLGTSKERCIFIGDTPSPDFDGPRAYGMKSSYLIDRTGERRGKRVIRSFAELKDIL